MTAKKKVAPKRGASRHQASARKAIPGWLWMGCGLVIGGFSVFLANLEPGGDEVKRDEQAAKAIQEQPRSATQPANRPKYDFYTLLPESEVILPPEAPKPEPPPPPATVTPEQAAKIDTARAQAALSGKTPPPAPPVAAAPAPVPPPTVPPRPAAVPPTAKATPAPAPAPALPLAKASTTTQFFLQAGSFRQRTEADRVRAQILMLGHDVRVESVSVRDETWYRVLVGPYSSRERLTQVQKSLASSGYANLLLQQRQVR